jgi:glycosyltransferase involved in cell wall biosynthesis
VTGSGTTPGRLLVITSNYPRWAGDSTTPFVLDLTRALADRGWEADVLAPHAPDAARDEVLGDIPVHRFRYLLPERAQTVCYQGGALVNLRQNRINLLKLPALVGAEWATVVRRMRSGGYDAVHAHWVLPQGLVGVLATRKVPVVVTVHGGDVFALDQGPLRAAKRLAFGRAAAVTVNSSATERAVLDLTRPRRLERIPMGIDVDAVVDTAAVERLRREHRRGDGPLLALVGRVVAEKGIFDLLHAVDRLRADLPGVRAVVLGEGQDRVAAEARAADLGLGDHIAFVGWVNPTQVPAWLAAADVIVAPSRTAPDGWAEAQGLSIVEAMAARRPVVASDSGGIGDAIEHEVTGLVVGEGHPDQLAEAVRRLHADPALAARLAESGRARAVERFSAGASADAFSSLFTDLIRTRR